MCAEARVKRNRSAVPIRSRSQARIVCDLQLKTVSISLSDVSTDNKIFSSSNWGIRPILMLIYFSLSSVFQVQYNQLVRCSKGLERIQKCRKYIKFRPLVSVKEDPKAWWIYFINCYRYKLRGSIERNVSWDQCIQRARENIAYVKLYSEYLSSAAGPSITAPELKEFKNQIEWERGFEELRVLREVSKITQH